jgi:hypothetical protein
MEISHASTETQSAAVGITGKAEEVTVSTDAEFMMMIAHGIYSNKALALVRELLCNARDGHAKAGCLDKPIHVTLEDNKLVVRDHGTGIPNEIFAATYLTFGKSTKRKDKTATGGFGVGTKVPWAVCDTFSARNYINGTMTAYSIMKSDPAMNGKPTCTPVMTIPSTEPSGLEVSVPFPEKMFNDIRKCIQSFSDELNIPIIFNSSPILRGADYTVNELSNAGFTILQDHPKTVIQNSPFYVRQGDVIYPIELQEEFSDAYHMIINLMGNPNRSPILFLAEPDTIIPTLSRESLQYTDLTCVSIRALMTKLLKTLADNIDDLAKQIAEKFPRLCACREDFINTMWSKRFKAPEIFLEYRHEFKTPDSITKSTRILLMQNIYRWLAGSLPYLETAVTLGKPFREDITQQLKAKFLSGLDQYYYLNKERILEIFNNSADPYSNTIKKELSIVLAENMVKEVKYFKDLSIVNKNVLDTYFVTTDDVDYIVRTSYVSQNSFTQVSELLKDPVKTKQSLTEVCNKYSYNDLRRMLYVSKTVIISSAPKTMVHRSIEFFQGKPLEQRNPLQQNYNLARLKGARCIRIRAGARDSDILALSKHLTAAGYDVITLMSATKKELEEAAALAAERAKLKDIPLPTLGHLITDRIQTWPVTDYDKKKKLIKHLDSNPKFKGKAMYLIIGKGKELPNGLSYVHDYQRLAKMIGTDIICVSTKPEIAKVIKDGRVNIEEVLTEFSEYFLKRKDIRRKLFFRNSFISKRQKQNKYLTKYLFGFSVPQLTTQEHQIYSDILELSRTFPALSRSVRKKTKFYNKCDRISRKFAQKLEHYSRENFCDAERALEAAYARKSSKTRTLAREIMRKIMKEPQV